jgi:hypothetical protein
MQRVEIRVEGHLEPGWEELLNGFRIECAENNQTILIDGVKDQAALDRVLAKLRNLGLKLVSVKSLE